MKSSKRDTGVSMFLGRLDGQGFVPSEAIIDEVKTLVQDSTEISYDEIRAIAKKYNVHLAKLKSLLVAANLVRFT